MAEKLSERLDEMGKDLTSMIEEVNGASATLSKTNRADEPVSFQPAISLRTHIEENAHKSYRSLRLSAFSTPTCPNCRSSTWEPPSCRPRWPLPKRPASRSRRALDMGMPVPVWVEGMPPMISTARTWDGDRGRAMDGCLMILIEGGGLQSGSMGKHCSY